MVPLRAACEDSSAQSLAGAGGASQRGWCSGSLVLSPERWCGLGWASLLPLLWAWPLAWSCPFPCSYLSTSGKEARGGIGRVFPTLGALSAGKGGLGGDWRSWVSREEISCPSLCLWYGFCPWSRLWLLLNSTASQYAMHFCGTVMFI